MTLLTLAPLVSVHRLTMAAYELCGTFAVYAPTKEMQRELDRLRNQRLAWPGGWRQVYDHAGKPTSLWHRDPLVTLHELRGFCEESKGMHGHRQFCQAARAVTGVARKARACTAIASFARPHARSRALRHLPSKCRHPCC